MQSAPTHPREFLHPSQNGIGGRHCPQLTLSGKIIAVGFCWGARYALLMAQKPSKVDVVIANHPSFAVDADVEAVEVPVAFLKGDQDVRPIAFLCCDARLARSRARSRLMR